MNNETEEKFQNIISRATKGDVDAIKQIASFNTEDRKNFDHLLTLNFLLSQSSHFRGKVIDASIFLEMMISQILSKYFSSENKLKENLLNSFVFDRMIISSKLSLLRKIIKTQYPILWDNYKQELKEISELLEFRNNLAHSMLNTSTKYIESVMEKASDNKNKSSLNNLEEIEILYYQENTLKNELITKSQIDEYYTKVYKKIAVLQKIESDLY